MSVLIGTPVQYTALSYYENGEWLTVSEEFKSLDDACAYGSAKGYARFRCRAVLEQEFMKLAVPS